MKLGGSIPYLQGLSNNLHKIASKWVPHTLTEVEKWTVYAICHLLINTFQNPLYSNIQENLRLSTFICIFPCFFMIYQSRKKKNSCYDLISNLCILNFRFLKRRRGQNQVQLEQKMLDRGSKRYLDHPPMQNKTSQKRASYSESINLSSKIPNEAGNVIRTCRAFLKNCVQKILVQIKLMAYMETLPRKPVIFEILIVSNIVK